VRPLPFSGELAYVLPFWLILALWWSGEGVASVAKRSRDGARTRDRNSFLLIMVFFWIGLALSFSLSFLLPQATIPGNPKFVFFLGLGLMLAGVAFRWYAMAVLGRFFTFDVAIQQGHVLVQAGPYRYIRHPSYTGALVTEFGIGLALGNWASILALVVSAAIAYAYRIAIEEAALLAALGEPYREYMRHTRRLLPFFF
jgi:protein-S-isoprenylcysteine O-methyltransferase